MALFLCGGGGGGPAAADWAMNKLTDIKYLMRSQRRNTLLGSAMKKQKPI